jgi:O-antigen/teichoic acid export membrane protein
MYLLPKYLLLDLLFLTTPLLTGIYSPEAYGYFSFFNTLATNFATISTLGFSTALIIASDERDFYNLFISLIRKVFINKII